MAVDWRRDDEPWRSVTDVGDAPDVATILKALHLPKPGEEIVAEDRQITLPTDGTLYEAELAHCSSCEPTREVEREIELEQMRLQAHRMCLEVELLALELGRRQALSASGDAVALDVGTWPLGGEASDEALSPGEHDALPEGG